MTLFNSPYLVERRDGLKINVSESEIADAVAESSNKPKAFLNYYLTKVLFLQDLQIVLLLQLVVLRFIEIKLLLMLKVVWIKKLQKNKRLMIFTL